MPSPVSSFLSADVSISSANTYFDGPSITLAPGAWFITGQVTVEDTQTPASITAKLTDGTTNFSSAEARTHDANGPGWLSIDESVTLALEWIVSPTVTTTYTIKVASTVSGGAIKAATTEINSGNNASSISASPCFQIATNAIAADVNLSTATTFFDGPTISLTAGKWLISGHVTVLDTAGAGKLCAKLWIPSLGVVLASGEEYSQGAGEPVQIPLSFAYDMPSTADVKISVASAGTSTNGRIKAAVPDNGAGNTASTLVAKRVSDLVATKLASTVNMDTHDTFYDGPSVTLTAGQWLLTGEVTLQSNLSQAPFVAKLWDGTTVFASGEAQTQASHEPVVIRLSWIVSPSASTTYKLSAAFYQFSSFGAFLRDTNPDFVIGTDPGSTASCLSAVLIGSLTSIYDIPMLAADCKVLSLWNGTSNDAPPTGWEGVAFDDSGWATAVSPALNLSNSYGEASWVSGQWPDLPNSSANTSVTHPPPPGCQLVSTTTATSGNGHAQFLIRWRFFLPVLDYNRVDSAWWTSGVLHSGSPRAANFLGARLNDSVGVVFDNDLSVFHTNGLPGQVNLITHKVNGIEPFPTTVGEDWIAEMWETLFLRFSNSTGPVVPPVTGARRAFTAVVG